MGFAGLIGYALDLLQLERNAQKMIKINRLANIVCSIYSTFQNQKKIA
jgi:hypothetical protein